MQDIVGNKTLRDLWEEMAEQCSDRVFLTFEDCYNRISHYTYRDFNAMINRAANFFLEVGVQKGELVAVQLRSSPEFMYAWFGLAKIGGVMVPLNTAYKYAECKYIIEKCEIRRVVMEKEFLDIYQSEQAKELKLSDLILARTEEQVRGTLNFYESMRIQPETLVEIRPLSSEDPVEIIFTSGTTSRPKGAVFTHCNTVYAGIFQAWQCGMTHEDTVMTVMPCFYISFQLMAVLPALTLGCRLVVEERYSARRFWKQVRQHKVSITEVMPMIVRTMLLQPVDPEEQDHCVKQVFFSLGMSTEEKEAYESRFKIRLLNCYGLTESLVCVAGDPYFGERRWPSVGKAGISYTLKIVDEKGKQLPANEVGEICVQGIPGRTFIKEYYQDPEETAKLMRKGGWMFTGDKGYLDEDGWLFFVDRKVNMIKRSGENIASKEVENVIASHLAVNEAAVIGVDDPIRDQAVKAIIQLKEGISCPDEEILDYCRERLADFKVPTIIEYCEDFPRTCTGKIQKNCLQ